jgi:hypothetical protein
VVVEDIEGESVGRAVEMTIHDKSRLGIFYRQTRVDPQTKVKAIKTVFLATPLLAVTGVNFPTSVPLVKLHTEMTKVRTGAILFQHLQEVLQFWPFKFNIAGES